MLLNTAPLKIVNLAVQELFEDTDPNVMFDYRKITEVVRAAGDRFMAFDAFEQTVERAVETVMKERKRAS